MWQGRRDDAYCNAEGGRPEKDRELKTLKA